MKKKGFTLIELLVVIAIIAMLLAILMPALSKVKKIAQRVVCGTNLKGLGTAQTVYAHDYNGQYTVQGRGGAHTWANVTQDWANPAKNWSTASNITVGASLYLLVREADVSPKSFVCPSSNQTEWDQRTAAVGQPQLDIVEVWDFGNINFNNQGPYNTVSYSYHQPYAASGRTGTQGTASRGRNAADGQRSASFAVMSDRNPFFDDRLEKGGATAQNYTGRVRGLNWETTAERWETLSANSQPHDREGQNVLYADGHTDYVTRSDVGTRNDNIFTPWPNTSPANETDRRTGAPLMTNSLNAYPRGIDDSIVVNDWIF